MFIIKELLRKPTFLLKLVELVLTIIPIAILQSTDGNFIFFFSKNEIGLIYTVLGGYIIILTMEITRRILKETNSWYLAVSRALLGTLLWFAAGGVMLRGYDENFLSCINNMIKPCLTKKDTQRFLSSGIFAVINSFVFLLDIFATFKYERSQNPAAAPSL